MAETHDGAMPGETSAGKIALDQPLDPLEEWQRARVRELLTRHGAEDLTEMLLGTEGQ